MLSYVTHNIVFLFIYLLLINDVCFLVVYISKLKSYFFVFQSNIYLFTVRGKKVKWYKGELAKQLTNKNINIIDHVLVIHSAFFGDVTVKNAFYYKWCER